MTTRRGTETQRAYVERVLRTEGRIATFDVLYSLAYDDGRKCSITRLAAIIHELRAVGWNIATDAPGALATYRLIGIAESAIPWRCVDCGAVAIFDVRPVLGGMGQSRCDACHATRYFRRAAA
jgi:hypothetical protein